MSAGLAAARLLLLPLLCLAPAAQAAEPPVIITEPFSQEVYPGQPAVFDVLAVGDEPLVYQWYFNQSPIPGAVDILLMLEDVHAGLQGDYYAVVTNLAGRATSEVARLTVLAWSPQITRQPVDLDVFAGGSAVFSMMATGTPPLQVQWRKDGLALAAATNNICTIIEAEPTDAGLYDVVVTNVAGAVTSRVATLTVFEKPLDSFAAIRLPSPMVCGGPIAYANGGGGFHFQARSNIFVTALGYHEELLSGTAVISLFDQDRTVLASAAVSTNSLKWQDYRYTPIPPVQLAQGDKSILLGMNPPPTWIGEALVWSSEGMPCVDASAVFTYLGGATAIWLDDTGTSHYLGPNFMFSLTPSTTPPLLLSATLTITNSMLFRWPTQAVDFVLQSTSVLGEPMKNVAVTPVIVGPEYQVTLPATGHQAFFRLLSKP